LSFAEQQRLDEYNREREAMEAPTSIKGNVPSVSQDTSKTSSDPLAAIQSALLNARLMQAPGAGSVPQSAALALAGPSGAPEQRTDYERQNDQEQKTAFGQQYSKQETEYLTATRQPPQGQYEVKAGRLIPAVLEQQLNSDLLNSVEIA
jgi:type IV secretory pathway VirB10-like protein